MHTTRKLRGLRLATGALLITTAAAGAAHVAFADTSKPTSAHRSQDAATAAGPGGGITQNVYSALEALVTRGTINQSQADAVQRQVLAGSVDPEALVADGTLSNDQMRQVADSLRAVKFAAGGNRGTPPDLSTTPMKKPPPPPAG